MLLNFFNDYKASKGRDTNIHPHKPKISVLHPFHENWSFSGFAQVRVTQACNLHVVGQFLKFTDAILITFRRRK
jgi:hypothetical protein